MKKLKTLLNGLSNYKVFGSKEVSVSSLSDDTRRVAAGGLFVAISGTNFDAHEFIPKAIGRKVAVVVGEKAGRKSWLNKITYIRVPNSRLALSLLASAWYDYPARKLKTVGVTGTDGKTTTASLIYWILKKGGKKVGLITSIGAKIGNKEYGTGFHVTNPESLPLQKFLKKMVDEKCEYAVLEVTSHGLDQERVAGVDFDLAVLTNITHEHLDYHKTWLDYFDAKAKLFEEAKAAVLNKDDLVVYDDIKCVVPSHSDVVSYGIKQISADYYGKEIKPKKNGTEFNIVSGDRRYSIKTKLLGDYNVLNILAASAASRHFEIPWREIQTAILTFKAPIGRLDEIKNSKGIKIYVDFAHTPNSLTSVLSLLNSRKRGRLITVFGCAGERDVGKRAQMGEISTRLADISIFTAEDPRSEDVNNIIDQMVEGVIKANGKKVNLSKTKELKDPSTRLKVGLRTEEHIFFRIPERGEAIFFAIQRLAKKGDIVVICGKGHEKSMAYQGVEHPWSDRQAVINALNLKKGIGVIVMAAGLGKRMKSDIAKVLHRLAGRPMIALALENLRRAGLGEIVVVVGYQKEEVIKQVRGAVKFAVEKEMLGTADATSRGLKVIPKDIDTVVVLNGDDSAFYRPETIRDVIATHEKERAVLTFVSLTKENPTGLGRVVRDKKGNLIGIVEEKDASDSQREIKEVNDGLYVFDKDWLEKNLPKVTKSPVSGEYYLVSLVSIALRGKNKVVVHRLKDANEWFGVNTREELAAADKKMRERIERILNGK